MSLESMAKEKMPKVSAETVEDMVTFLKKKKHSANLDERLGLFEKLVKGEGEFDGFSETVANRAHYLAFGRPGDENFKGAYSTAHGKLYELATNDTTKLKKEDIEKIVDAYGDELLTQLHKGYKDAVDKIKGQLKDLGKSEKEIEEKLREFRKSLLAEYHVDDEGRGIDLYAFANVLKNKKRAETEQALREWGDTFKKTYTLRMLSSAQDLFKEDFDERTALADKVQAAFDEKGFQPKKHAYHALTPNKLAQHYAALITGTDLKKQGYEIKKKKAA